ncbi:MAG: cytochrome b/b6 domain-containing protein [Wenzhouxiangella sp.]|jgi:cytochrome b|nr:cytochrome b/b6 domain-containing protein [Wenzhouxiangella sp.]
MSPRTVKIWDLPLRLFHWLLLACVAGALVSVQLKAMDWHGRFGLAVLGLLVFRLIWGFIGSTHARFLSFAPRPSSLMDYLRGRWTGLGHNPLGALSVFAILSVLAFQAGSGLFADDVIAYTGPLRRAVSGDISSLLTRWHMRMEYVIYALIALHLAAIAFHEFIKRERLVKPMITGRKAAVDPSAGDARGGGWVAFAIAVLVAVGAVWVANGALLPPPPPPPQNLGW